MTPFDSDWDPYEELIKCQHNIEQCALAINTGSEIVEDLSQKYQHQQQVIEQLMFQNRKLQQMLTVLKTQLEHQEIKITGLESRH